MKALLCSMVLATACLAGDEMDEIGAIRQTVAQLNVQPARLDLFTDDSEARVKLDELYKGRRLVVRPRTAATAGPTVVISKEPWGEAQIVMPPPVIELASPRVVSGAVRLVTSDVAIVDAAFVVVSSDGRHSTPLVFVMKKDGGVWKIASLRVLAER